MSTQIQTRGSESVYVDLDGYDRIRAHSPGHVNERIAHDIEARIRDFAPGDRERLSWRIDELDREWDADRAVMVVFAAVASLTVVLSLSRNRRWLAFSAIQFPFIIYHAAKGWCPPMAVLRRLGFRSTKEIDAEKYALKTLRGDFR